MRIARLAVVSLFCAGSFITASAASEGDNACYSNGQYSVVQVQNEDGAGTRFLISAAKDAETCGFDESGPAHIIGDEHDPLWFVELVGRFLVLSRSTESQGDLVVYDLQTGATVLDVPANDFEAYAGGITFWQRVVEGTPGTCPDYARYEADGFGAVIVEQAHYDFGSGTIERKGKQRCDPVP